MASGKSNSNHVAIALMAVAAILGSYEALASQQASSSVLIASLSSRDDRSAITALESAVTVLEMEHRDAIKSLSICGARFAEMNKHAISKGFPKHMLTEEQAKNLAVMMLGIRKMESDLRKTVAPIGLETLHSDLRRALAEARSEVVVTFEMVRQIRGKPESIEGRIDMNGLKALAERSTHRLLELASA
ncbi:hypothetical protein [Pseudomonas helleri]|uniref:hypothetical protein n=1 Tax=Pseudomonas helleri TaxID=1608996 RepID=UPI003F9E55F9